ncbi:Transcriptional regulator, TetR family [Devosia sp. LC5]|uniref:TetR/AcrR family transcriptional regulator n=1 Tax=Devosia sp. LC5 TaxID=1502724 RepID=UPI0004E46EBD|nr:TetR/AcrR family transcriptional regulator [Devosia sp. LC5]KFC66037.1 Transcriptional regulator, TetR family [Devosia sp. LC5]
MTEPSADDSEARRRSIGARRNPDTQEAILDAAEAIVEEEGIAGFSIEAVARRARAGKPTIYKWWPGRTALLLEVYHRHKPANVHMDTGSVEGDVVAFFTGVFAHWGNTGAGQVFRFIVAEAQRDETAAASLRAYARERREQSGQIFERGVARGELAANIDTGLAADMLAGFAWHRLLTGRLIADPQEMRQAARQLVRGLLTPGA